MVISFYKISRERDEKEMRKMYDNIKMMLAITMALLLTSLFSIPVLAADPSLVISKVNTSSKVIALTFDDCTNAAHYSAILDILSQNNVKATFFAIGEGAAANTDLINRTMALGCQIGNHSNSHPYFSQLTYSQVIDEVNKADTAIKGITGQSTKPYFRPPYGDYSPGVLQALGDAGYSKTIYWTMDTLDSVGNSTDGITQMVLGNAAPGAIVLMHINAGSVNTQIALPGIISKLKAQGYKFVTIAELLTYGVVTTVSQYTVKSGDTLARIAAKYGVTVQSIASPNSITNANILTVGRILNIPGKSNTSTSGVNKYTVKYGDTLAKIAATYGGTVQSIAAANNIANPNTISIGQVLSITGTYTNSGIKYTLKSGDTLGKVAAKYKVTVLELVAANNIANANIVRVGQVLVIP